MPYIKSDNNRRKKLQEGDVAQNAGELNYQIFYYVKHTETPISVIIKSYVDNFLNQGKNYQRYNDMTGALIRCHKEIRRRLGFYLPMLVDILESYDKEIDIYEDQKILENSDVE